MEDYQYPYYYQISNQAAIRNQRYFWICLAGQLCSACISVVLEYYQVSSLISGFFLIISLSFFLVAVFFKFSQKWKKCRFCAETIKSMSWQWMMKTKSFQEDDNGDLLKKQMKIKFNEVKVFCSNGDGIYDVAIKSDMACVRNKSLKDKERDYRENRVLDQVNWYNEKIKYNKTAKVVCIVIIVILYTIFGLTLFLCESSMSFLVVVATSVITWFESKKYAFIENSYSSILLDNSELFNSRFEFNDEEEFKKAVISCEKSFLSEHQNWAAKEI